MQYKLYLFCPGGQPDEPDAAVVRARLEETLNVNAGITIEGPSILLQGYANGYNETVITIVYNATYKLGRNIHEEILAKADRILTQHFQRYAVRTLITQVVDHAVAGLVVGGITGSAGGATVHNSPDVADHIAAGLLGAIIGGLAGHIVGSYLKSEQTIASGHKDMSNVWNLEWNISLLE